MGWSSLSFPILSHLEGHRANCFDQRILVTGGEENSSICEILLEEEQQVERLSIPDLPSLKMHATCFIPENCIMIAGAMKETKNSLLLYQSDTKSIRKFITTGDDLEVNTGHTMTFVGKQRSFYLFGGYTVDGKVTNKLYKVERDQYRCHIISTPTGPEGISEHTASLIQNKIYVFGGKCKFGPTNDLWCFDTNSDTWELIESSGDKPSERSSHGALVIGKSLLVYAGTGDFGDLDDGFVFHSETKIWKKLSASLKLPVATGSLSLTAWKGNLYAISPNGSFTITLREVLFRKEDSTMTLPVHVFDDMKMKIEHAMSLLEKTTEKHSQIEELLQMETLFLHVHQLMEQCKPKVLSGAQRSPLNQLKARGPQSPFKSRLQQKSSPQPSKQKPKETGRAPLYVQAQRNSPRGNAPSPISIQSPTKRIPSQVKGEKQKESCGRPLPKIEEKQLPPAQREEVEPIPPVQNKDNTIRNDSPQGKRVPIVQVQNKPKKKPKGQAPMLHRTNSTNPCRNPSTTQGKLSKLQNAAEEPLPSTENRSRCLSRSISANFSEQIAAEQKSTNFTTLPVQADTFSAPIIVPVMLLLEKEGNVWKRKKQKGISKWKFRYFKLYNSELKYYTNEIDCTPLGVIDMTKTRVKRVLPEDLSSSEKKKWCMEFTTVKSVYHIAVESEKELAEWILILNTIISNTSAPSTDTNLSRSSSDAIPKRKMKSKFALKSKPSSSFKLEIVPQQPNSLQPTEKEHLTPRECIIKEIIITERDYVNDLLILTEFYMRRLEDRGILNAMMKDAIFANVRDLVPVHQQFLAGLEIEFAKEDPFFAAVFSQTAPAWKIYSNYCSSQSNSSESIASFSEGDINLSLCLEELRQEPECKRLDLSSYLIKPMQRICKYPLLLRELDKATPSDHPEHSAIQQAAQLISGTLLNINEDKRESDNFLKLFQLQESLTDYDLRIQQQGRKLIKEGEFKKVQYESNKEPTKLTLWLLDDRLLILRKREKGKYSLRLAMMMDCIIVWDLDPNDTKNVKAIITAHTPKEKMEWMELLNNQIALTGFVTFGGPKNE